MVGEAIHDDQGQPLPEHVEAVAQPARFVQVRSVAIVRGDERDLVEHREPAEVQRGRTGAGELKVDDTADVARLIEQQVVRVEIAVREHVRPEVAALCALADRMEM